MSARFITWDGAHRSGGFTLVELAINSDFDLYSSGPDGQSMPTLNATVSRDDIVRAADGAFYGVAASF